MSQLTIAAATICAATKSTVAKNVNLPSDLRLSKVDDDSADEISRLHVVECFNAAHLNLVMFVCSLTDDSA